MEFTRQEQDGRQLLLRWPCMAETMQQSMGEEEKEEAAQEGILAPCEEEALAYISISLTYHYHDGTASDGGVEASCPTMARLLEKRTLEGIP